MGRSCEKYLVGIFTAFQGARAMTPEQAQELRKLILSSRDLIDRAALLLDKAEAALAEHLPGGDHEKQREAERGRT